MKAKHDSILKELKHHAPFTLTGALTGIVIMLLFQNLRSEVSHKIFYVLHPVHVLLSALVTAGIYKLHRQKNGKKGANFLAVLIIGYVGSVGIATLSDSIIPYIGEILLDMPNRGIHIGFIEKWQIVNPLAFLGILIAYFWPQTRIPHAGHVLLSTWASLFHIVMAKGEGLGVVSYLVVFVFLFLAVWLPCCLSDIIFPMLFVKAEKVEDNAEDGNSSEQSQS